MNWIRLAVWTLAPLAGAALVAKGAKALKPVLAGSNDRVARAIASGSLSKMIAATRIPASAEERHRLLSIIVTRTYKDRQNEDSRALFLRFAQIHVDEYGSLRKGGKSLEPAMQTHKLLAIVLEEDGRWEEAVRVSRRAMDLGLEDGTKTGFSGRIKRLEKKAAGK